MEKLKYHLLATFTVVIWGSTFISSKYLLLNGMTPAEIMVSRFVLAYGLLWIMYPHFRRVTDWHDEGLFLMMGLFGGSIYFLAENTALNYTQTTNVSLICATVPIVTALFTNWLVQKIEFSKPFILGSLVALLGVVLVVLNGQFMLNLSPVGDLLTFVAVVSWALYCVPQKMLHQSYDTLFVTRKIFFYGILTILPYFAFYEPFSFPFEKMTEPVVWGNLIFLGLVASGICFYFWNKAMEQLGVVTTNNYVYLLPLITLLSAHLFLKEIITIYTLLGSVLIIGGLWWTNKR